MIQAHGVVRGDVGILATYDLPRGFIGAERASLRAVLHTSRVQY